MKRPRNIQRGIVRADESKRPAASVERGKRDEGEDLNPTALFGFLPVLERLRNRPASITKILASEGSSEHRFREAAQLAKRNNIPFLRVSGDAIEKLVGRGVNHQGIAAVSAPVDYHSAEELLDAADEGSLFIVLDGVEDPRNLGAILRSAECAGADGVFIPERRAVGLTATVAKSSAGAVEHIKVARVQNINRLIEDLKRRSVWVVGSSGDADMSYADWDWNRPTALVMGGEGSGLHRLVAENCDVLVKIPMYGKIGSLNVSVAAGILLFEAQRQRKG